jgi:hypothetical protein
MIISLFLISWYIFGLLSFIYWWTKEFDFKTDDMPKAILVGCIGILAYPCGWFIHGDSKILINRRK